MNRMCFSQQHSPPREETSEVLSQQHFFSCWKFDSQRRTANFEAHAVKSFVIGRPGFPAAKHDANPFVCKGSQGGMVRFSALSLLVIIGASPSGPKGGLSGKLMERLPQEFGTGQAPVNPDALAAFLGDGSD